MPSAAPLSYPDVADALLSAEFVYAKTMPHFPHHYTLRKKWTQAPEWEAVVQFIRDHGYAAKYEGRKYLYLDINGCRYWTMGASLSTTILINRAELGPVVAPYDAIASSYDRIHSSPASMQEDFSVIDAIGVENGESILDIGCGTGLLLDRAGMDVSSERYLGVDPSARMLDRLIEKHPWAQVVRAPFENFWPTVKFDRIASLFGSPSYIPAAALQRIPSMLAPGGSYFLMFYREGAEPVTHERSGVRIEHFAHPRDVLDGDVTELGNYFVIRAGT